MGLEGGLVAPVFERRTDTRGRVGLTALVRRARKRNPVLLRVVDLGPGGARCRTAVPFRLGATFPVEFLLDGKCVRGKPRVFPVYCRVTWTLSRLGPSGPVQEIGLAFLELKPSDRQVLAGLLRAGKAA